MRKQIDNLRWWIVKLLIGRHAIVANLTVRGSVVAQPMQEVYLHNVMWEPHTGHMTILRTLH